MTTSQQDKDFALAMFSSALRKSLNWIANNLEPEDVFGDDQLFDWARSMGPDMVFSDDVLIAWAHRNGYTLREEI